MFNVDCSSRSKNSNYKYGTTFTIIPAVQIITNYVRLYQTIMFYLICLALTLLDIWRNGNTY
jgi:hypothetical protein